MYKIGDIVNLEKFDLKDDKYSLIISETRMTYHRFYQCIDGMTRKISYEIPYNKALITDIFT